MQAKFICVLKGKIYDVALDLRKKSKTYGKDFSAILSEKNSTSVFIPKGFAHGYLTLEPNTIVTYLVKGNYNPDSEHSIVWETIPKVKNIIDSYLQGCTIWISDKDRVGK